MKKFNGFENWFLTAAIVEFVKKAEQDVEDTEKDGNRSIFAKGYFTMVGNELLEKVDSLTSKEGLKDKQKVKENAL